MSKALPTYYEENINQLQNPIKPGKMDMDYYRFCMADLRRWANHYQTPEKKSPLKFYMYFNNKLHKFSYSSSKVRV